MVYNDVWKMEENFTSGANCTIYINKSEDLTKKITVDLTGSTGFKIRGGETPFKKTIKVAPG